MTSVPPPGTQVPTISFVTLLGPDPVRIKNGDSPIFFMMCAGSLHHFKEILPEKANAYEFARLMTFARATGRPLIFITTFLELQVVDSRKEKEKHLSPGDVLNLRHWGRAAEGRGIVKEFSGMRSNAFAFQYAVVDQMALESVQVEGLYEDLRPRPGRPQNIQKSVPSDAPRNDLRIRAMFDAATALRARLPTMDMYSYLRGEAIAARYNAILKATGVGPLDHFGGRVRLGDVDCQSMVSDIDTLAHVLKHIPPVQPASYPTGNATNTGWERLVRTAAGEWLTYPKYRPRSSAPPRFEAIPDWSVIYIIDANILQERVADLVAFGKRFRGRVKWMSLPYVEHEISQGLEPDRSVRVNGFNQMMAQGGATRLKTQNVSVSVLPTLYKPNKAPVVGKALTGDLAIRAQLGLAITGVAQRTSKKMRTLVVLATEDYVAAELLRTVTVDPKVKLECLRVDKREKGQVFQDMLWGAASGYCVSK